MEIIVGVGILVVISLAIYLIHYKGIKRLENVLSEKDTQIAVLNQQIGELQEKKHELVAYNEESTKEIGRLSDNLSVEIDKYKKLLSQKKSSETRLGQITEQIVPFLAGCPYRPEDMHFFGKPIDFVVVDFETPEIIFLEIKTGNAKESSRQRVIKNAIRSGNVYYEKMRINENGVKIKREKNDL